MKCLLSSYGQNVAFFRFIWCSFNGEWKFGKNVVIMWPKYGIFKCNSLTIVNKYTNAWPSQTSFKIWGIQSWEFTAVQRNFTKCLLKLKDSSFNNPWIAVIMHLTITIPSINTSHQSIDSPSTFLRYKYRFIWQFAQVNVYKKYEWAFS